MRFLLRRTGLTLAAGSIIFCCSCERHHVGELAREQEGASTSEAHPAESSNVKIKTSSPAARATPAQFFPTATPH